MALQHLRSSTANKRPTGSSMSEGQIALNTNTASPGVFFKDSGGSLIKVGPVHIGTSAPNSSPAGSTGNAIGEQWLDTTGGGYVFKIWDGTAWRSESGTFVDVSGDTMTGALILPSGTAAAPALGVGSTDNGVYSPGADQVAISTNGAGRLFIDSSGRLLVGTSSAQTIGNSQAQLEVSTDSSTGYALSLSRSFADIYGPQINLRSTRGTAASPVIVNDDDQLGSIAFYGYDGTDSNHQFASISSSVDGTPGLNDCPGRLVFSTTADGASSPTERMRIDSSGNIIIGTSSTVNPVLRILGASSDNSFIQFADGDSNNIGQIQYSHSSNSLIIGVNGSERMRIDSSGRLLVGTSSTSQSARAIFEGNNSSSAGVIRLACANSSPANGDVIGSLVYAGDDHDNVGDIYVSRDGGTWTQGSSQPTRMVFSTTADGASSPTERMRIDSSGNVGIGTTSPTATLDIERTTGTVEVQLQSRDSSDCFISFGDNADGDVGQIRYGHDTNYMSFTTNASERARIDSSGRLLVGTSSSVGNARRLVQIASTSGEAGLNATRYINDAGGAAAIDLAKSRSGTIGTQTIVQNGDTIGYLQFRGSDGTNQIVAANIKSEIDGTPGANDMPGRLVFSTTKDGASSPVERVKISNNGTATFTADGGSSDVAFTSTSASGTNFFVRNDGFFAFNTKTNGPYNLGISSSVKALYIDSNGYVGYNVSTRAAKTNIQAAPSTDWIDGLEVVTFNYRHRNDDGSYADTAEPEVRWGVIADDAVQVNPDFCSYSSSGELDGFHYDRLVPVLLKAIQELKSEVAELKAQLS